MDPLSGGPEDEVAPQIDSAKTFPSNGQINFDEDRIVIKFDEFIRLNKPNDNILITPQPKKRPEITVKNKTLKIQFEEGLQENTTYSINFNRAVTDITEANDSIFQFVFSTGDYIDSLAIDGRLTDGFTNKPEQNFLMALYPVSDTIQYDSIPYLLKPTYIGQSDQTGSFKLNYIKNGKYHLFAIQDRNRNLKLDAGEKLAITDEAVLSLDSIMRGVELKSFKMEDTLCRIDEKRFTYPGRLEIILSNPAKQFDIRSDLEMMQEETDRDDSLVYWLGSNPIARMQFYLNLNGEIDTIKPLYKGMPESNKARKPLKIENNIKQGMLLPGEDLVLTFSEPLLPLLDSAIHFYDLDSNEVDVEYEIENVRSIRFKTFGKGLDRVVLDSAELKSVFGNENTSTTELSFENHEEDYYGTVTILLDSIVEETILVELLNSKGEVVNDSIAYGNSMRFENLLPENHQLRLIFDENGDGEWTSGSLKEGRRPERVIYYSGEIKAKSKWEKEVEWSIKY